MTAGASLSVFMTHKSISSAFHKSCLLVHKIIGQEKPLTYGFTYTPSSDNWYQNLSIFPFSLLPDFSFAFQWRFITQETVNPLAGWIWMYVGCCTAKIWKTCWDTQYITDKFSVTQVGNHFLACCEYLRLFPGNIDFGLFILNLLLVSRLCLVNNSKLHDLLNDSDATLWENKGGDR